MRSWLRAARRCPSVVRSMGGGGLRRSLGILAVIPLGLALAADHAAVEAREYSPYLDPAKPVLSFLLSDPQNVDDFRREFGLSGGEMKAVLATTRQENRKLAGEYAESERLVAANRDLSAERVAGKIAASDYDEEIEAAVARTKRDVEALFPEDRSADLRGWVDERWELEAREASTQRSGELVRTSSGRALRCKVFATQYIGYTRYEAALPHRGLKFGSQPRVRIRRVAGGNVVRPRIKEVGPWNTYDNYWRTSKYRTMWKNLPRCIPEARAAYFNDYNNGKDEFGRKVLNPAGVDLTPAVARGMGLRKYQNAWVYVSFPWLRR